MSDCKKAEKDAIPDELSDALSDPDTVAFLKDYLAITDDDLKAHVRRLVEEIRTTRKKKPKP